MPKYIVVTGVSNAGKTSTIRSLWKSLGDGTFPKEQHDFHGTLNYKGLLIGFHSWGDNLLVLENSWGGIPALEKEKCDVIVSACKSYGQTQKYFTDRCPNPSNLFWVAKIWHSNKDAAVEQASRHIEILIDSFIK